MTTTNHSNCDHEATKSARATCRRDRAAGLDKARALVRYLDTDTNGICDWLAKGAYRFARDIDATRSIPVTDRLALAVSLLDYFDPQESAAWLENRRANGYTITSDPATIRRIILRAFS